MIRSLKYRIALTVFLLEAVMVAVVLWRYQLVSVNAIREQMDATDLVVLEMLEEISRYAIINEGYDELQPYVEKIRMDPHILRVLVADYRTQVVVSTDYALLGQLLPQLVDGPQRYWRTRELTNASGRVGTLAIEFSSSGLARAYHEAQMQGLVIAGTSMLIIAVVGMGIGFLLTRRLGILDTATRRFAQGDFDVRVSLKGGDETVREVLDPGTARKEALKEK
jgi:HAMP domain-containing protein